MNQQNDHNYNDKTIQKWKKDSANKQYQNPKKMRKDFQTIFHCQCSHHVTGLRTQKTEFCSQSTTEECCYHPKNCVYCNQFPKH